MLYTLVAHPRRFSPQICDFTSSCAKKLHRKPAACCVKKMVRNLAVDERRDRTFAEIMVASNWLRSCLKMKIIYSTEYPLEVSSISSATG